MLAAAACGWRNNRDALNGGSRLFWLAGASSVLTYRNAFGVRTLWRCRAALRVKHGGAYNAIA